MGIKVPLKYSYVYQKDTLTEGQYSLDKRLILCPDPVPGDYKHHGYFSIKNKQLIELCCKALILEM